MALPESTPGAIPVNVPERRPAANVQTLKWVRKTHLYLGLFIAPALLFFAFTGAVQTLSLHESAGTTYTPPGWLARLGQWHKNQNILPRKPRPVPSATGAKTPEQQPGSPAAAAKPPFTLAAKQRQHLPEKIFFLLVSLGLFLSTLSGIFMAYRYERRKLLITFLLLAGIAVPLLLLPF